MIAKRLTGLAMIGVIVVLCTGCPPLLIGDPAPTYITTPIVATGAHHTCVQNGRVFCWGDNSAGQLGNGTTTSSSTPVLVSSLTWVASLSAAANRTCAVAGYDHYVWCWGDNSAGQLGDGTTTNRSTPIKVPGLFDMTTVSVGDSFTCATRLGGGIVCWGEVPGVSGGYTTTPVPIAGLDQATSISMGADHACAISATVKCFGDNSHGQLGDGSTTPSAAPVEVPALAHLVDPDSGQPVVVDSVVAGGDHTCAASFVLATYWCWGDNAAGQLGDGTTTDRVTPQPIAFPTLTIPQNTARPSLALGDAFTCIGFAAPPLYNSSLSPAMSFGCFGDNSSGQLGDGTTTSRSTYRTNSTILTDPILSAGGAHACAFGAPSSKMVVRCWGANDSGQVGNGTTVPVSTPVAIPAAYGVQPAQPVPTDPSPVVTLLSMSSTPAAGQPITFTFRVQSVAPQISFDPTIVTGAGVGLPLAAGCGSSATVWSGTDTDRTVTLTCTLPAQARGGDWRVQTQARAFNAYRSYNQWPFHADGTSGDNDGPVLVSQSTAPASIRNGQSITFTAQVNESDGPLSAVVLYSPWTSCDTPSIDGSAAPLWTVTVTCTALNPVADVPVTVVVEDVVGNTTEVTWSPIAIT